MRSTEPVSGLIDSILFTVPYLLTNQNIVCKWTYDDVMGQKLVENKNTIGRCSMQEKNAREKHVITENPMVYEITLLYKIWQINSAHHPSAKNWINGFTDTYILFLTVVKIAKSIDPYQEQSHLSWHYLPRKFLLWCSNFLSFTVP